MEDQTDNRDIPNRIEVTLDKNIQKRVKALREKMESKNGIFNKSITFFKEGVGGAVSENLTRDLYITISFDVVDQIEKYTISYKYELKGNRIWLTTASHECTYFTKIELSNDNNGIVKVIFTGLNAVNYKLIEGEVNRLFNHGNG